MQSQASVVNQYCIYVYKMLMKNTLNRSSSVRNVISFQNKAVNLTERMPSYSVCVYVCVFVTSISQVIHNSDMSYIIIVQPGLMRLNLCLNVTRDFVACDSVCLMSGFLWVLYLIKALCVQIINTHNHFSLGAR